MYWRQMQTAAARGFSVADNRIESYIDRISAFAPDGRCVMGYVAIWLTIAFAWLAVVIWAWIMEARDKKQLA